MAEYAVILGSPQRSSSSARVSGRRPPTFSTASSRSSRHRALIAAVCIALPVTLGGDIQTALKKLVNALPTS
jgi:Flp pilus assembly pilin Flp